MILFQKPFSQKLTALILIVCLVGLIAGPILLYPHKTQAQCPVQVIVDVPQEKDTGLQTGWEALKSAWRSASLGQMVITASKLIWQNARAMAEWALGVFLNILLHQLLAQLTNDIVNFIQSGDKPRFLSMDLGDWLWMGADKAIGAFIDQYLGAGWLCEPFDLDIKFALLEVPSFEEEVRCSLSDIVENIEDFYSDFSAGGWKGWIELSKPQNNFYGSLLLAQAEKLSVETIAKEELAKDMEMGQGYLSPKDCYWYDAAGALVEKQEDVWGTPSLPAACQPDPANPGMTTGGFRSPCQKKCQVLTPASSLKQVTDKGITNFYDQLNAQLGAATAKAGPYQVYVQAIINALVNRVITEGVGLLKADSQPSPDWSDTGESGVIPALVSPEQTMQDIDDARALLTQLAHLRENVGELLQEQENNLTVKETIPPAYQGAIVTLEVTIANCEDWIPGFASWAESTITDIENNRIPAVNANIFQLENVEIPETLALYNDIDLAVVSIEYYIETAEIWLALWEEFNGDPDNIVLPDAEAEMHVAKVAAIDDLRILIAKINGVVYSTNFSGFLEEIQQAIYNLVQASQGVIEERGNPNWPTIGTLYGELDSIESIRTRANQYSTQCIQAAAAAEGGGGGGGGGGY